MDSALYQRLARSQIVRDYEASFAEITDLTLKFIPKDPGSERIPVGPSANPFCALLARNPTASKICSQFHAEAISRAAENSENRPACWSCCFAGMAHVHVPVIVAGGHVATLFCGVVLLHKPTKQGFNRVSRELLKLGIETHLSPLENAYLRSNVISKKQFRAILRLLQIFAGHLSQYASGWLLEEAVDEPFAVRQAKAFAKIHAAEQITMQDAAGNVRLSASYFCKMFKRTALMTFTEYLSRVRVERAKALLANGSIQIGQVAFDSGFGCIPHFNRVFRRYAGVSPTQYRASLPK